MTTLQFFTVLSAVWIGIAWVPYILDRVLVRGLMGAMANPGPDDIPQSPWAQRAKAAHKVAVESFVAFAPLSMIVSIREPLDIYSGAVATTYFFGIVAHYIIYTIGIPVARTLAFALASLSTLALGLHVLGIL